jgi:hypothetical protein
VYILPVSESDNGWFKNHVSLGCLIAWACFAAPDFLHAGSFVEFPAEVVQDKILGGLLGHLLGDLNGLKHEMKYIDEPGDVQSYVPALPEGAWTDDDTDFEWVYVIAMQKYEVTLLPQKDLPGLWRHHINRQFWCANQYARQLMDLGIDPPLTGQIQFNPWSDFNIAGQFTCESWGLIAPGMPQTASRIGLNYTRVVVDGEPAQATQLFDTMIATAFLTGDMNVIMDAGLAAVDAHAKIARIVEDVRLWHRQNPIDWRITRRNVKEKYSQAQGEMRDRNGFELNTASVIGALLYGENDFVKTAMAAFNFGWDADNNAATACTLIGVIKGGRWIKSQGWNIADVYRNTTRDDMPMDETISRFGIRLIELAERVIIEQGGKITVEAGQAAHYRISTQKPANVERLSDPEQQTRDMRDKLKPEIEFDITHATSKQALARAAYEAICLDLAPELRDRHPEQWAKALEALTGFPKVISVLFFESPTVTGDRLRARAFAAGVKSPDKRMKIW